MTSIGMAHGSDPTTASPIAWAVGGGDELQSGTFRALAWSQADDSGADPLPYIGGDFEGFAAPAENAVEPSSAPRYRRSTLLYGIASGFFAVAVGGLMLTVLNTGSVPATTSPVVVQPAQSAANAVSPQQIRPTAPASAPRSAPVQAVPTAANTRPIAVNVPTSTPTSTVAAVTPVAAKPPAPEAPEPQAGAPESAAPQAAAPETAPQAEPPAASPPVASPPLVSLPEITPQPVPHPVGPTVFHVPVTPEGPMPPMVPNLGGSIPPIRANLAPEGPMRPMVPNLGVPPTPVIAVPAAPAASNPGITLNPGVTVPPMIPKLPAN